MASVLKISPTLRVRLTFIVPLVLFITYASAQVCSDPANVVYGLTNSGLIHPINVNTGVVGTAINPAYPGNAPDQSNGLAYNGVSGKFYYFKRIPSSTIIEFVCFDPATNTYTMLSSPATTSSVYSGSITNDGTGYYCWDTQGRLFYYKISTNTWTTITSSLVDQFGKDVDSIIRAHASGDGAIDGYGNLWILPSSDTRYGLFRLSGPLPTSPVASLSVQQIVPMTVPPSKFVGIAFTTTGEIFMCTANSKIYRLEDDHSLTLMSTMTVNMGDLTSCNFPFAVLAPDDIRFSAAPAGDHVNLSWLRQGNGSFSYVVERSGDNREWRAISTTTQLNFTDKITFIDRSPLNGKNFYRVRIMSASGDVRFSRVRIVDLPLLQHAAVWPNPVNSDLFISNSTQNGYVTLYDQSGNKIKGMHIRNGINSIDVSPFPAGRYFITIRTAEGTLSSHKIIKK